MKAGVENTSEGGGLYKGPFEITAAQYNSKSNFGGKMSQRVTALEVTMKVLIDGAVQERTEYLTVNAFGKSAWKASEDGDSAAKEGNFLYSEDDGAKINTGTPHGRFMKSLVDLGVEFPNGYDAEVLVGIKGVLAREDAPVEQKKERTLAFVSKLIDEDVDIEDYEESDDEEEDDKPTKGKAPKPEFKKSGKVPAGVDKKKKGKDEDEEEEEESDDEEEDEDEEEEEEDAFDKATLLEVVKETLAANKGKVKLKMMGQAIYAVVPKKFKQLAAARKEVAEAVIELIEAGGAKKVATYDEKSGLVTAK